MAGQIGTQHALESGDDAFSYNTGVTFSHLAFASHEDQETELDHFPAWMSSLFLEFTGRTGLSGSDSGRCLAGGP